MPEAMNLIPSTKTPKTQPLIPKHVDSVSEDGLSLGNRCFLVSGHCVPGSWFHPNQQRQHEIVLN